MFLKISIGLFFLQIVQTPRIRAVIYTCVGTSTIFSIAMLGFAIFQCGVYDNIWDFIGKRFTGKCVSDAAALGMTFTHGAITIITDWMFLILPFFILRGTLMAKREKLAIGFVLAFGSISGIAAIARLPYIRILAVPKSQIFGQIQNIAIWSAVEPAVGIIAGSLVTVRPLFRALFPAASRGNGYSPMEVPSLVTIETTVIDPAESANSSTPKLEAFYDSSFGSSRPMTPESYNKEGNLEAQRRPSDAATLVGSPNKTRGKLNKDFQFPAAPPVFAPHAVSRPNTAPEMIAALPAPPAAKLSDQLRPWSSKKKNPPKQTFLLDQTVDEPEKDESVAWNPPNWDAQQDSPRHVAKPILPTPSATASSGSQKTEEAPPPLPPLTSRFQTVKPNSQEWELRDWDSRAPPIAPLQKRNENETSNEPQLKKKPKDSMLKRHLSKNAKKVFPDRGKSMMEPGLPLDMFFGDSAGDDMSDTGSSVSRQQSRRTDFSG
jgi:hypothetical protein